MIEENLNSSTSERGASTAAFGWLKSGKPNAPDVITLKGQADIKSDSEIAHRITTNIGELDRVLGGGLVRGSFILLAGEPGVGKSTLLLQMAGGLTNRPDVKVLYVSAEESVGQTRLRARRLGVESDQVYIATESNLNLIFELVQQVQPEILICDSIQTLFMPELESAPGTVSQVRECSARLLGLAKTTQTSVLLIGHITKDGQIAGPKVLEHMVDAVLSFEGDINNQFRLLRALKNRFGATNELGVFEMFGAGLREIANPSALFLEERGRKLMGSAIYPSMEGSRPILCEIQALTAASPLAMPRRTALGFDLNRVHLLVAVLSRHLGLKLSHLDVFVNVVGGLKIQEPAADLAVTAALMSTDGGFEIDVHSCFVGEVGLTGEIRAASLIEMRVREAIKLGYTNIVLPESNRKHLVELAGHANFQWMRTIEDLQEYISGSHKPGKRPNRQKAPTLDA